MDIFLVWPFKWSLFGTDFPWSFSSQAYHTLCILLCAFRARFATLRTNNFLACGGILRSRAQADRSSGRNRKPRMKKSLAPRVHVSLLLNLLSTRPLKMFTENPIFNACQMGKFLKTLVSRSRGASWSMWKWWIEDIWGYYNCIFRGFYHVDYLSNTPHSLWVYRRHKLRGMLGEHEKSL